MIQLTVNGKTVISNDPDKTLLRFLRDDLYLIGAKDGCSRGQCGTCTVIVNGKAVRSCTRKMKSLEGAMVETIEGLAEGDNLHPIQIAFLKRHAYQCGFCTPGIIMATKALLDSNPHPTDDEIKHSLRFNICRCTGYVQIIEAIRLAIDIIDGKEKADLYDCRGWVGESPVTKNGIERVTGKALFTDDFKLENSLEGKLVFPEYPHAKILSIDTSEAMKQPGVVFIATHKDIPGYKFFSQTDYPQQILAIDKVRFIGDPIAIVYAETEQQAYDAMKYIHVEYEVLPVIKTAKQGYEEDSIRVHEEYPNKYDGTSISKGNVEKGFTESDIIVEEDISTQIVEHGSLEPDVATAQVDDMGRVVVYGPGQNPTIIRAEVAAALGVELNKIRTITRPSGGAFGKREIQVCHIFAALGTFLTKRPVRVILSRNEVNVYTSKRHAIYFHYKVGANKDGKLMAMQTHSISDAGAYSSHGDFLMCCASAMGSGPYDIPNVDFNSYAVFTNKVIGGSFRGFGSTQVAVAVEIIIDRIAEKCGISPFKIRRINGLDIGKQTPSGQIIEYSCGFNAALDVIEKELMKDGIPQPSAPGKKVGLGIAGSFKNIGDGRGMEEGFGARIHLTNDGKLELLTGAMELGQGHDTTICQIAAQTLGVNYNDINIGIVDDDVSPYSISSTSGSKTTYMSGNAVRTCCIKFKDKMLSYVGEKAGISDKFLDCDTTGVFDYRKDGTYKISFADIGKMLEENGDSMEEEHYYSSGQTFPPKAKGDNIEQDIINHRMFNAYIFAAQAAIVEVDEETGKVDVIRVYAADDCGRAINPALAKGQITGAVMMGVGYALSEKFVVEDGYNVTKEYGDLGIPKFTDAPDICPFLIEEIYPLGPFGAKGLGEVALNPTAPAILNAIYDAVGVRINSIPVDQDKLAAAIKNDRIYK